MSDAATIPLSEVLELLDGPFEKLASSFAAQEYTLWLGSGISRSRVDDLGKIVIRVLEHLRSNADPTDPACRFRLALDKALALAMLSAAEADAVDLAKPVSDWAIAGDLRNRLVNSYAELLNVVVEGEPPDYLLWTASRVMDTYADPHLEPDVEHICLAILILERAAKNLVSANWDGLIESAMSHLAGPAATQALGVCVRSEDLPVSGARSALFKIHGCAIRARDDEATYRPLLIARSRQVTGWTGGHATDAVKSHLTDLASTTHTLMIGLSAQDSNIQYVFVEAATRRKLAWPCDPSPFVFAEAAIGNKQRSLLEQAFASTYDANSAAIEGAALMPAYAKPFLVALVLKLPWDKAG